jgi:multimeric flavodoxin WrbA/protein-tyrosine-phosphatase
MYVLGIQGSPRKKGNCDYLLTAFLRECQRLGAQTSVIRPQDLDIQPCKELIVCEKKGFCPIKDEMDALGYTGLRRADVVVLASPVFFYGVSAQAKVFIDRCQMFWGRRYKLGLKDPARFFRQGFLLSVGASAGKRLFEGVDLTGRYFFDAISADYAGALTYKKVEAPGDILARPELDGEIQEAVSGLVTPLKNREKMGFVSPKGAVRAVMAAAFAMELSMGKVRAMAAGVAGPSDVSPDTTKAMAESGLDVKYMGAQGLDHIAGARPGQVFFLGSAAELDKALPLLPEGTEHWALSAPRDPAGLLSLKEEIAARIRALVAPL